MLTATDGDPKDDPDLFRIKIWTEVDGVESIIYDNKMDIPDDDNESGTELGSLLLVAVGWVTLVLGSMAPRVCDIIHLQTMVNHEPPL